MRFLSWLCSLHKIFLFADILFLRICSIDVVGSLQPKNFVRATITGQSWVHLQFFSIFGDFCPNQPIFDQLLVYICLQRRYNLFSSLNVNWPDHIRTEETLSGSNFYHFRGILGGLGLYLKTNLGPFVSHFNPECKKILTSCQKFSLKSPKFHTSRKISAFSLKEIDRSLLLEDFLRKSEIVYSGDF